MRRNILLNNYIPILLIILQGLLVACQSTNNSIGRLRPENCELPCWRSIQVGQSQEEDFLQIANTEPDQYVNLDRLEGTDFVHYSWSDKEENALVSAFVQDEVITYIRLVTKAPVSLGEAVEVFGPPDTYIASIVGGGGTGSLRVELFYEHSGIVLSEFVLPYVPAAEDLDSCSLDITAVSDVQSIHFVVPGSAQEMADSIQQPIFSEPKAWPGFGRIEFTTCDYDEN